MNPANILVIDDNATNRKLVCYILNNAGYSVQQAGDAEEAKPIIERVPPDLILMDIQMPGIDGLAFTRVLRADPGSRNIRIVALTSFAMKGDEAKARAAGCDGYITKPIDTDNFPNQVRVYLTASTRLAPKGDE